MSHLAGWCLWPQSWVPIGGLQTSCQQGGVQSEICWSGILHSSLCLLDALVVTSVYLEGLLSYVWTFCSFLLRYASTSCFSRAPMAYKSWSNPNCRAIYQKAKWTSEWKGVLVYGLSSISEAMFGQVFLNNHTVKKPHEPHLLMSTRPSLNLLCVRPRLLIYAQCPPLNVALPLLCVVHL